MPQTKHQKEILSEKLVMDDLSENGHRIRRNLIIFSTIVIFCSFSGADIVNNEMDFYGLKIHISNPAYIIWLALAIVGYQLLHFIFINFGHLQYLKIRTTKANKQTLPTPQYQGGFTNGQTKPTYQYLDSNGNARQYDEKQSNLYEWWTNISQKINQTSRFYKKTTYIISPENAQNLVVEIENLGNLEAAQIKIGKMIGEKGYLVRSDIDSDDEKEFKDKISETYNEISRDVNQIKENNQKINSSLSNIKLDISATKELLSKIKQIVEDENIAKSLEKFNRSYVCYKATEALRFGIIEFLIPISLGVYSIEALVIILIFYY